MQWEKNRAGRWDSGSEWRRETLANTVMVMLELRPEEDEGRSHVNKVCSKQKK